MNSSCPVESYFMQNLIFNTEMCLVFITILVSPWCRKNTSENERCAYYLKLVFEFFNEVLEKFLQKIVSRHLWNKTEHHLSHPSLPITTHHSIIPRYSPPLPFITAATPITSQQSPVTPHYPLHNHSLPITTDHTPAQSITTYAAKRRLHESKLCITSRFYWLLCGTAIETLSPLRE